MRGLLGGLLLELFLLRAGLVDALLIYARNVFLLSILISLITGGLVFLAVGGLGCLGSEEGVNA